MAMKICNYPSCTVLVNSNCRYCVDHGSSDIQYNKYKRDKDSTKFYLSRAWKKKREEIMEQHGGLCYKCKQLGLIVSANVVDHIVEYKDNKDLALSNQNLMPLCHKCHNIKTNKKV